MYKSTFVQEQTLIQYSQTKAPGRTYKYVEPRLVIFPFGTGMGYHQSSVACTLATGPPASAYTVTCTVEHLTGPAGDEIIQLYHIPPAGLKVDHPLPIKRLIGFERVHLPAAKKVEQVFKLTLEDLRLTDKAGGQSLYPGDHTLEIWLGHAAPVNLTATVSFATTEAERVQFEADARHEHAAELNL
jgi:hypothetical protein